jgi:hypothetical protein
MKQLGAVPLWFSSRAQFGLAEPRTHKGSTGGVPSGHVEDADRGGRRILPTQAGRSRATITVQPLSFVLLFVLFGGLANADEKVVYENYAGVHRDVPACSAASITTPCRDGGEVTSPGCSIAYKVGQRAICRQGSTYTNTCTFLPARCGCYW